MKRILILILGLFGVAQAQFAPTSAKTAFKNGVSIGTKDSTAYGANDSLVVVINRQGRMMYRSTDGYWKLLANAASSDYVPYTGAVDNVNLGTYRLTARSLRTDSVYANSSAGMYLLTNSGAAVAHWGGGGSVEVDFKGFAGYDANRAGSYTARSFTDKNYVDSADALRVRYTDTAAMLSDYVDLGSSQTIAGLKTFSNDIVVNGYTFGRGANNNSGNLAIGSLTLTATTSGSLPNIAIGNSALRNITTGASNVAIGTNIMTGSTVGSGNTNVGQNSFADVTSGGNNTSLGNIAGRFTVGSASVTSIDNSTYIGANTRPSATTGVTNETALGYLATGNGSNTVTIGNSSVTDNYFTGNIRGGAFIKSGGTSFQFLKADGSVDSTSYATAASLSGYLPLSGGTLTGALSGTSLSMSGAGSFGSLSVGSGGVFFNSNTGIGNGAFRLRDNSNTTTYGLFARSGFIEGNSNTETALFAETGFGINFYTGGSATVRQRISPAGNTLIKTTTESPNNEALQVAGSGLFSGTVKTSDGFVSTVGGVVAQLYGNYAGGLAGVGTGTNDAFGIFTNNTARLTITNSGAATFSSSVTATGFIVSSDYRYKDIISQDGDLYQYTLKNDETKRIHYGYVAQEIEKTLPFAVTTNSDGYKAVNYTEVHAIKIRELEKRIEQLEKQLNK